MTDLYYVAGTVGFFVLMLGYVSLCERLGARAADETAEIGPRP